MSTAPTSVPAARGLVWSALGIVYVVWGSTYLAIAYALETVPAFLGAGLRFLVAGLVLVGVAALRRRLRATPEQLGWAALVGLLLLVGGNGLVVLAEKSVPSGIAALIIAGVPLWIVVIRAVLGERPARATVGGVALGFVGVTMLLLPTGSGESVEWSHALAVVLASISWSLGSVLAGRKPLPPDPVTTSAVEMLAGAGGLLLLSLLLRESRGFVLADVSAHSLLALAYLVVFGSLVAFSAYSWLLTRAPINQVATYAYVNPVVAVGLGSVFRGEPITPLVLGGGAVIVAAVAVVISQETRSRRALPSVVPPAADAGGAVMAAPRG